jgi:hypothetical protein
VYVLPVPNPFEDSDFKICAGASEREDAGQDLGRTGTSLGRTLCYKGSAN